MTTTVKFKIEKRREVGEIVETITVDCEAAGDQAVNVLSECVEALSDGPQMPMPFMVGFDPFAVDDDDLETAEPEGEA